MKQIQMKFNTKLIELLTADQNHTRNLFHSIFHG
jgi:hypothetical protein